MVPDTTVWGEYFVGGDDERKGDEDLELKEGDLQESKTQGTGNTKKSADNPVVITVDGPERTEEDANSDDTGEVEVKILNSSDAEDYGDGEEEPKVPVADLATSDNDSRPAMEPVPLVETEIEPSTVALPVEQEIGNSAVDTKSGQLDQAEVEAEPNTVGSKPPDFALAASKKVSAKKRLVIVASAVILTVIIVGLAWFFSSSMAGQDEIAADTNSAVEQPLPVEQPKFSAALTAVDGKIEYMRGETDWTEVDSEIELEEGAMIRTGDGSRAVLTIEDGSLIRLGANTTLHVISLAVDSVEFDQIDGIAYSRVVPSERRYVIDMSDVNYESVGTAFITFKQPGESGVQVFQGAVRVDSLAEAVAEGEQYFAASNDVTLAGVVSDIEIDNLVEDDFIAWNTAEDSQNDLFKDSLGALLKIQERADEIEQEKQLEQARREEAERQRQAAEEARKEAEDKEGEDDTESEAP